MRNFKTFLVVLLCITAIAWADITIKGDARVRPRYDLETSESDVTKANVYYMYWVRLWLDATLSDGWYFTTKLAADGPGDFAGTFGSSTYGSVGGWTDSKAAHSGDRAIVRFVEFHFGRKTDNWGFSTGYLPFNALANPEFDLHFYPVSQSDIPYLILNQNSAAGFRGYYKIGPGKLNATLTVDDNDGLDDGIDSTDNVRDQYSLFLDYQMKVGGLSLQPTLIKTIASLDKPAPLTVGANVGLPKVAGIGFNVGGYYTMQSVEDGLGTNSDIYSGFGIHGKAVRKLGPGTFVAWGDYKSITYDGVDDPVNTTLLWVMYKYVVYSSDLGSFALAPTVRQILQYNGSGTYSRTKVELTMHFAFK